MMRIKLKNSFAVILVLLIAFSLLACTDDSAVSSTDTKSQGTEAQNKSSDPVDSPNTDVAKSMNEDYVGDWVGYDGAEYPFNDPVMLSDIDTSASLKINSDSTGHIEVNYSDGSVVKVNLYFILGETGKTYVALDQETDLIEGGIQHIRNGNTDWMTFTFFSEEATADNMTEGAFQFTFKKK